MTHTYHETLDNYHPDQILHDGCLECEERSRFDIDVQLSRLDVEQFERAWRRAAEWKQRGCRTLAHAEIPLLSALWGVQVQLEQRGVPIGEVPGSRSPLAALFAGERGGA